MAENYVACADAMRLLEAIATIIDGPIADTRLHEWSGLPERVRLKVQTERQVEYLGQLISRVSTWACLPNTTEPEFNGYQSAQNDVRQIIHGNGVPLPAPPDAKETA